MAEIKFSTPASHNTALLVVEGNINLDGKHIDEHSFILFKNEGEEISFGAEKNSVLLFMSGVPIEEPIASYGPFVMNTQQEIFEAVKEFQS